MEALDTTNEMWPGYQLIGYYDPAVPNNTTIAGMKYNNFQIVNCSVRQVVLNQYPNMPLKDLVISPEFTQIS